MPARPLASVLALVLLLGLGDVKAVGEASRASRRTPIVIAVEKAAPTVVNINTESLVRTRSPFQGFFPEEIFGPMLPQRVQRVQSLGSGAIVHADGYVITNMHVIGNAQSIKVSLLDGREFEVEEVVPNPSEDLALLKLKADKEFPVIAMGDSHDLLIGETVVAVGNPFGFQHSVTTGVISALNRRIKTNERTEIAGVIQTDAAINQGNSGGPLLNINGELIGINTVIFSPSGASAGLGFAIPSARVVKMINRVLHNIVELEDLMGIVGITNLESLSRQYRDVVDTGGRGLLVLDLDARGYAAQAGMAPADVLIQINDRPVADLEAYRNIIASVTENRLSLTFLRMERTGPRQFEVNFTFPEDAAGKPQAGREAVAPVPLEWMGVLVGEIDAVSAAALGARRPEGVMVLKVSEGAPAFGLVRVGDVITRVEGDEVKALADFRAAMGKYNDHARVRLGILRDGQRRTVQLSRS